MSNPLVHIFQLQAFQLQAFNSRLFNSRLGSSAQQAFKNKLDHPAQVAKSLVEMLWSNASSRYFGWPEKLFIKLNGLFPSLVSNAIGKQLARIKEHASFS